LEIPIFDLSESLFIFIVFLLYKNQYNSKTVLLKK